MTPSPLTRLATARFGWIADLKWSPDGRMLAVCGGDGIAIYRGGFGVDPSLRLRDHAAPVKAIAFSADARYMASASADTTTKLWRVHDSDIACVATLRAHASSVEAVACSPVGLLLATGGADNALRLWNLNAPGESRLLGNHEDEVTCLAFNHRGSTLCSGGRDGAVRAWNLARGQSSMLHRADAWIRSVVCHPLTGRLAALDREGNIVMLDPSSSEEPKVFGEHGGNADALAFSPSGDRLFSGGRDGALRLWDVKRRSPLLSLEAHARPVMALACHPAGALLVSGGGDNRICLWALDGGAGSGAQKPLHSPDEEQKGHGK